MNTFIVFEFIVTSISWFIFLLCFAKDRSRYRNIILLGNALGWSVLFLTALTQSYIFLLLVFYGILLTPIFLIINGIQMIKNEGYSLPNVLSLVLGLVILIGEVSTYLVFFGINSLQNSTSQVVIDQLNIISAFVTMTVIYFSVSILLFVLYSIFLQIVPHKRDFDYIIIHGAGLIDGHKVSKLLSDRIDKAIEVYKKDPTPPIMIPSGGQGSDEDLSEAAAMAQYMIQHGIPEDMIILEDQSENTYRNLVNAKAIIDSREGSKYTTLVTSNYHVYRALRICRQIGFDATGIGSHVAFYYWPSALLREYIAVHAEKKHFIILMIGWLLILYLTFMG